MIMFRLKRLCFSIPQILVIPNVQWSLKLILPCTVHAADVKDYKRRYMTYMLRGETKNSLLDTKPTLHHYRPSQWHIHHHQHRRISEITFILIKHTDMSTDTINHIPTQQEYPCMYMYPHKHTYTVYTFKHHLHTYKHMIL